MEDDLGVYQFNPIITKILVSIPPTRKQANVEELAGIGATNAWVRDGNLINDNFFTWLWEGVEIDGRVTPGVGDMMDLEFDMYNRHLREKNGLKNIGWLKTMFYPLIRHIIRQDTGYWILYACLNSCQVSYDTRPTSHISTTLSCQGTRKKPKLAFNSTPKAEWTDRFSYLNSLPDANIFLSSAPSISSLSLSNKLNHSCSARNLCSLSSSSFSASLLFLASASRLFKSS